MRSYESTTKGHIDVRQTMNTKRNALFNIILFKSSDFLKMTIFKIICKIKTQTIIWVQF
jgi:hypothetical protein